MFRLPDAADPLLSRLSIAFTRPTFQRMLVLSVGSVLALRRHTVTGALRAAGGLAAGRHTSFHRVLSRARWSLWPLARALAAIVLELVPEGEPVIGSVCTVREFLANQTSPFAGSKRSSSFTAAIGTCNFFISIQIVVGGVRHELPPLDFETLWGQIDLVPGLIAREIPGLPADWRTVARPLPPHVVDQRLFLRLVRGVFAAAVCVAATGLYAGELLLLIGVALAAVFGVWWAVLGAASKYRREVSRRRAAVAAAWRALDAARRRWKQIEAAANAQFDAVKRELWDVRERAGRLRAEFEFEFERRQVEGRKRELQLRDFLERQFVRDHKIPKVGPGRLATLLSYGIETAADIDVDHLDALPGFGPTIIGELTGWRDAMAARFRYDPSKEPPAAEMRGVFMKYKQLHQAYESRLRGGPDQLRGIVSATARSLTALAAELGRLEGEHMQAMADVRAG
jgi:hypothetical protein